MVCFHPLSSLSHSFYFFALILLLSLSNSLCFYASIPYTFSGFFIVTVYLLPFPLLILCLLNYSFSLFLYFHPSIFSLSRSICFFAFVTLLTLFFSFPPFYCYQPLNYSLLSLSLISLFIISLSLFIFTLPRLSLVFQYLCLSVSRNPLFLFFQPPPFPSLPLSLARRSRGTR